MPTFIKLTDCSNGNPIFVNATLIRTYKTCEFATGKATEIEMPENNVWVRENLAQVSEKIWDAVRRCGH